MGWRAIGAAGLICLAVLLIRSTHQLFLAENQGALGIRKEQKAPGVGAGRLDLREALALDPENPELTFQLGLSLMLSENNKFTRREYRSIETERIVESLQLLEKAQRTFLDMPDILRWRGETAGVFYADLLQMAGKHREREAAQRNGLSLLLESIRLRPQPVEHAEGLYSNAVAIACRLGQADVARATEVLARMTGNADFLVHQEIGIVLLRADFQMGNFPGLMERLRGELARHPNDPRLLQRVEASAADWKLPEFAEACILRGRADTELTLPERTTLVHVRTGTQETMAPADPSF